ncbi:hypothetical protein GCM10009839_24650 [Catenulispora yoronensis]|uniref:Uncharacterized protein n=1 Tax=Catenulispora yoronensis TaxID=450799 RepID=A0ABP5FH09_9ACTN
MALSDWLQSISLLAVAGALIITVRQAREMASQTRSMSKSLEQSSYRRLIAANTSQRSVYLKDDPDLLAWHLGSRGYPEGNYEQNKQTLWLLVRLDQHEENYLENLRGMFPDGVWAPWVEVMRADFAVPEFPAVWSNARRFFSPQFITFIDDLVQGLHPLPVESAERSQHVAIPRPAPAALVAGEIAGAEKGEGAGEATTEVEQRDVAAEGDQAELA